MPKFLSSIKVGAIESLTGNTTLLHLGSDNRVGIGTSDPETKLHVDGAITATGLVLPPGILSDQGDSATTFGFNPNFTEWNGPPENSPNVANGYSQTGDGVVQQSSDSNLGGASARFYNADVKWSREVEFASPLYANAFIQGTMTYKFEDYTDGEPGLAITLTHRERLDDTSGERQSNTFIVPTYSNTLSRAAGSGWQTGTWRAHTPGNREITKLKVEVVSTSDPVSGINDGGAGNATSLGGGTAYDWYLDGFSFSFMHPDVRLDQLGRITGAYIAFAAIDDLHIKDMISSKTSLVQKEGTSLLVQGEVANLTYANGWSIAKTGLIKATDIEIYAGDGTLLIDANARDGTGRVNPFTHWQDRTLADFDPQASTYLYGLSFEESNKTGLMANISYLATSGLDSDTFSANYHSVHFANVVDGSAGASGSNLSNGFITFNGITTNAPPGSIFTGIDKNVIKDQDAHILFLSNTQKWDTNIGAQQKYHANAYLGEYGLYVLGTPTVGGWLYHPHGNNTWYTIDSTQSGDRLHENDFLVIGNIATDSEGKIRPDKTFLQPPKHPDSVTSTEAQGSYPPIGITAGGVLFADIHLNQWNHAVNAGEIQFTNQRNLPNTRFTFVHPGTDNPSDSVVHVVNGAYGVLTSLEDFPGSRYITFVGASPDRFTLQVGHSPDFVAAFPLGNRWFYNQDEGSFAEFTPSSQDCIVARVDSNGSSVSAFPSDSSALTNIYRYAEREAITAEGATLSDLIIDPPKGMDAGGLVLADLSINKEYDSSSDTFKSNAGFIALVNDENDPPKNSFYVIHPNNGNNWLVDTVGRGVVTSLKPTSDEYGTRHIAFVGTDTSRFSLPSGAYENVSNSFVAVAKYDSQGNPRADGKWYYDNGDNISGTFTPDANDFIIATINSFDPSASGIDQINRWAAVEGQLVIDGVVTSITSIRNLLNARIDVANAAITVAIDLAANAFANAVTAQANAAQALGLLDGAITVFFEEEGAAAPDEAGIPGAGAANKFANNKSDDYFDYRDLWINVSPYNEALDGSWYTNAIFTYSNTAFGFDGTLAWAHDPTNPGGRAYLSSLEARGFADRATTIYYMNRIENGNGYGPNVAIIALSGHDVATGRTRYNFNPEGDLWFDTTPDDQLNHPYVYRTNTSFSTSNTSHTGYANGVGTKGEWAQTIHTVAEGSFVPSSKPTGWYDIRDTAIATATDSTARASATAALAAAATAQIAADREILAYFQISTDIPDASGNGDIWIHTDTAINSDGTKNTGAIFIANGPWGSGDYYDLSGHRWFQANAASAIGLMYLESYSAGVLGEFQRGTNIVPRALSLFDSPVSEYTIDSTYYSPETTTPYYITARGGSDDITTNYGRDNEFTIDSSNSHVGDSSLRIKIDGSGSDPWSGVPVFFANVFAAGPIYSGVESKAMFDEYAIPIPKGKKWIYSLYAFSNYAGGMGSGGFGWGNTSQPNQLVVLTSNGTVVASGLHTYENGDLQNFAVSNTDFTRHHTVLDFRPGQTVTDKHGDLAAANNIILGVSINQQWAPSGSGTPEYMWIDGVQLEEVPNTVFTPSQFKEPSDGTAIVFGRKITDGKIVTHYAPHTGSGDNQYGPIPNTTPTGLANPQPHGDFWVNTSNNNIIFRYYQDGVDVSTQTVFWSTSTIYGSGWYTTEDLRTSNALSTSYDALSNAETAQAAADREIIAFFQTTIPIATGNGDVWIDTDSFATLNTSSIYVAFSQGATATAASPTPDRWYPSPTSAIGQVYLNAYLAERRASRAESFALGITGSGDLPFPVYPDANGIYVGATGNLAFYRNSATEYLVDQSGDDEGRVFISNRGGIDLVGPNGKIWYPQSGDFGIPESGYVKTDYREISSVPGTGPTTVSNTSLSSLYLMYTNMDAVARFGTSAEAFGDHSHIIPVRWNNADGQRQWEAISFGENYHDFIPDSANGDFLVAYATRPTAVPEGLSTLDSWVFKTLPVQTQAIGDGKIVTHFGPHWPLGSGAGKGTHGPQANLTPTGLANPEPHGDFWVNTSNNNLVFRYFQKGFNYIPSAQTIFWSTTTVEDGWYTTEDLRTANALSTSFDALANAETAQAAADREILAYFKTDPPTASGNGDVWIDTDSFATLNTSSIYVAFTAGADEITDPGPSAEWVQSPNSAIGQVYLNAYLAERRASRAESFVLSVTGSGDLPFPVYPDANGIYVGATGNLAFYRNSATEYLVDQSGSANEGKVFISNRDGIDLVGPNGKIWYPRSDDFGIPEIGTVSTNYYGSEGTPTTDSNTSFSSLYLMYTNMNAAARFGTSLNDFGDHHHIVPVRWNNINGQRQWEARTIGGEHYDFIPDSANGDFLVAHVTRPTAVPEGFATLDSWVFKTLPVQTQSITDGKIVTHFGPHWPLGDGGSAGTHGPQANLTPTGLANPEPHGDFWINTSNNNLVFRYHSNTINKYAQTAYYTGIVDDKTGWYSTEDPRIANNADYTSNTYVWLQNTHNWAANLDLSVANNEIWVNFAFGNLYFVNGVAYNANAAAYLAQAAADREILAFFTIHTDIPNATGNGDIWIHTDNLITPTEGTLNTGAIFVANTLGSGIPDDDDEQHWWNPSPNNAIGLMYAKSYAAGVRGAFDHGPNIFPRGYAMWDAAASDYNITDTLAGHNASVPYPIFTELSANAIVNTSFGKVSESSLQFTTGNPAGTSARVWLANNKLSTTKHRLGSPSVTFNFGRGKKWIFSYYAYSNAASGAIPSTRAYFYLDDAQDATSNLCVFQTKNNEFSSRNEWNRFFHVIDFSNTHIHANASSYTDRWESLAEQPAELSVTTNLDGDDLTGSTSHHARLANLNSTLVRLDVVGNDSGNTVWFDGFQLEEVGDDISTPGPFKDPADQSSLIFGRRISDGKIVTHFYDSRQSESDGISYGPQANVTPTGLPNPEPHGDFWVDTGNNFIMFRYNQKNPSAREFSSESTFAQTANFYTPSSSDGDGWYAMEDPRIVNNAIHTSNLHVWLQNTHNWAANLDLFNSNNELWINFAFANVYYVNGVAFHANSAAYFAQAAADREILAFFTYSTATVPDATGNGDVWIHTDTLIRTDDGTLNTSAIFVANTKEGGPYDDGDHRWWTAPNNAIGLMYARSYAKGVGGSFDRGTNIVPRALSLFDSPAYDYTTELSSTLPETTTPFYISGRGGINETGENYGTNNEITIDSSNSYVGDSSLRIKIDGGETMTNQWAQVPILFANTVGQLGYSTGETEGGFAKHAIPIPKGKKWIYSLYAYSNYAGGVGSTGFGWGNTTHPNHLVALASNGVMSPVHYYMKSDNFAVSNTDFTRHYTILDFRPGQDVEPLVQQRHGDHSAANSIILGVSLNQQWTLTDSLTPEYMWIDGVQLEEVPDDVYTPSTFKEPSDNKTIVFGREITDGKIVTHWYDGDENGGGTYYGPTPNTTPTGFPNPQPHGDFWIDTGNNYSMFRYHQNDLNVIPTGSAAQTAYWPSVTVGGVSESPSVDGWYAMQDPRIPDSAARVAAVEQTAADALQQAAAAAVAADAEIVVFFELSTNATMSLDTPYNYGSYTGPATGNGDIWIQIDQVYNPDGTQNTGSIFFANLHPTAGWTQSPDNAIGRAFLNQFTAVGVKNWMSSGYSMWDADSSEYNIGITSIQNADIPFPLSTSPTYTDAANTVVNTYFGKVSSSSLQLTGGDKDDGSGIKNPLVFFANTYGNTTQKDIISRPPPGSTLRFERGKRWIFSYHAYSNSSLAAGIVPSPQVQIRFNDNDDPNSNIVLFGKTSSFGNRNNWERFSYVLDFSNTHVHANASGYTDKWSSWDTIDSRPTTYSTGTIEIDPWHEGRLANLNSMTVKVNFSQGSGDVSTMWFDGFQFEEAPGAQMLAGPFSDPDRRISTHFARSLADGKILTHYEPGTNTTPTDGNYYGPRPHLSPSGFPNSDPHGDFWIDTANNYALYRYNQNSSVNYAQTSYWSTIAYQHSLVGYDVSGWYSIADGRHDIIASNVATAFQNIENQLLRIVDLEGTSDHELQIFFEPEGGDFANATNTYVGSSFGDLWINTSNYNQQANGTLLSNAIFRWQNSLSGSSEYLGEYDAESKPKGLAWRHSPNNGVGQVYLVTYAAQNAADQKVTAYFMGGFAGAEYNGPQTNTTPTGLNNPNPDGDIWIDTSNNNVMHVFHHNPANPGTTSHALGFAQTIYYTTSTVKEGWYSAEDLRAAAADRALEIARATGTDRLVEIFANTVPPNASGNGDVWIKTDDVLNLNGSANLNAIHVANTTAEGGTKESEFDVHYWHSTPTSALGRTYLERLVSETGKNWVPTEISRWNAPAHDYEFVGSSAYDSSVPSAEKRYRHEVYNLRSDGSYFDTSNLRLIDGSTGELAYSNVQVEVVSDPPGTRTGTQKTANSYYGNALRIRTGTSVTGGSDLATEHMYVSLSANDQGLEATTSTWNDPRIVNIPKGKQWIVSAWFKSYNWGVDDNYKMPGFQVYAKKKFDDDGTSNNWVSHIGASAGQSFHRDAAPSGYVDGEWIRRHMYLDLSTSDHLGGVQGTKDDRYTYWTNNFTSGYIGTGAIAHGNSFVINNDDGFANISVYTLDAGAEDSALLKSILNLDNSIIKTNSAITFWNGTSADYEFAWQDYPTGHDGKHYRDVFFDKPYMSHTLVDLNNDTYYDTASGLTDDDAETGNNARVEIISDTPVVLGNLTGNSYLWDGDVSDRTGKALRIKNGPTVLSGGISTLVEGIHVSLGKSANLFTIPTGPIVAIADRTIPPDGFDFPVVGEIRVGGPQDGVDGTLHGNGIIGVGASGNIAFYPNQSEDRDDVGGSIKVENKGGVPFIGGGKAWPSVLVGLGIDKFGIPDDESWGWGTSGVGDTTINTPLQGSVWANNSRGTWLMYTNMNAAMRFASSATGLANNYYDPGSGAGDVISSHRHFVVVEWREGATTNTWVAIDNSFAPREIPFVPDAANGDFLVAQLIKTQSGAEAEIERIDNWANTSMTDVFGSPFTVDIPTGKRWVVSAFTKSWANGVYTTPEITVYGRAKAPEDTSHGGSANAYYSNTWYSGFRTNSLPYDAGELSGQVSDGEWIRKYGVIDLTGSGFSSDGIHGTGDRPFDSEIDTLQIKISNYTYETFIDGVMVEEVATGVYEPSGAPVFTANVTHETTFISDYTADNVHVGHSAETGGFSGYLYPRVVANVYNTHVTSTSSLWLGRLLWKTETSAVFGTDADQYIDVPAPETWAGAESVNTITWDCRTKSEWMDEKVTDIRFDLWANTEAGDYYGIDYITLDSGGNAGYPGFYHEAIRNEIDALGFATTVWDNDQEVFIDGLQVEDVTGSERRTPMEFQDPQESGVIDFSRAISDGKTIYFVSNTFHEDIYGTTGDNHAFGPDPSSTPNGLSNPEPYGDKWISLSAPFKTYLYFSNSTNKIAQSAYHAPYSGSAYANTNWPYGATNTSSGWYEYRDTGDALTQEGFQVALGQVAIGAGYWSEDGLNVLGNITFVDDTGTGTAPGIIVTNTQDFGQNKELLLNPVPPPDTNLHAHWTMNSSDIDESGNRLVRDVSGRNNHAMAKVTSGGVDITQDSFNDHDPASDFINISGNQSLLLDTEETSNKNQWLVLAANGHADSQSTYRGDTYPLDITQTSGTSGGYNKHTLTFWFKPKSGNKTDASLVGQDRASGLAGSWSLLLNGNMTGNNDIRTEWYSGGPSSNLTHAPSESPSVILDGWYGANDGGTYTPIRNNEWHFVAIQTDHSNDTQALWIYREGEGLLYYKANTGFISSTASTVDRNLVLGGDASLNFITSRGSTNGYYDEVRFYNSLLTPRNIRYLYMNPTGRPQQLQPRPGLAVKKGYIDFFTGNWDDDFIESKYANTFAYVHGFDVDGNPADINPYISFDGNIKYLKRGFLKMFFGSSQDGTDVSNTENRQFLNSGYVMYRDTVWDDVDDGSKPLSDTDTNYVFAQPIRSNTTQPHTWRYHNYGSSTDHGYIKFTPDDSTDLVVGDVVLANATQMAVMTGDTPAQNGHVRFDFVSTYQFARRPSVVRETHNFTITPEDFTDSFGGGDHFFANSAWWEGNLLNGTFIAEATIGNAAILGLAVNKLEAGEIRAKIHVGGETKVLIDGKNSRIVISD